MQVLAERSPLVSKELKALACLSYESRKSFDASLVFLQMQGYVTVSDFVYQTDRHGKPFGWGLAQYATPEQRFGADFCSRVYAREPAESAERIRAHLEKLFRLCADLEAAGASGDRDAVFPALNALLQCFYMESGNRIFPLIVFGSSSRNTTILGYLYGAVCFLT